MDTVMERLSEEEKRAVIEYGMARGKVMLGSLLAALALGWLFGIFVQSVLFLFMFCSLRRYAGGYHADSQGKCYVISSVVLAASFWSMKYIVCSYAVYFAVQTICLLVILALSPVENSSRRLEEFERIKYGRKTRTNAVLLFFLSSFLYWTDSFHMVPAAVTAYLLTAVLLIAGKIKSKYQHYNE